MYGHPVGRLSRGAVLDVGLKCVHSCKFCYYSFLDGSEHQFRGMRTAKFRTLDECKEILWLLKSYGFINFDYTGGEPTLHPDISEITRYAHQEMGLKGRIITLGQFLMQRLPHCKHERLIDDLLEAGLVNFLFSTHAVDDALFRRITGGKWSALEQAMRYLDDKDFQYTTNTTVFQWNYEHLPDIARTLIGHRVYLHNFIIMNGYYEWNRGGRAFGVQARYSDIYPYLKEAVEILEAHRVGVNIRYAPLCTVRGLEKHLVGVVGVRYDPYEWMNQAGHFGGPPAFCAAMLPLRQGQIDGAFAYHPLNMHHPNGVEVIGARGNNVKHFAASCEACRAREVCDGIDPNYLARYGADEFVPYTEGEWPFPVHSQRAAYLAPFLVKTEQYEDMRSAVAAAYAQVAERGPAGDAGTPAPSAAGGEAVPPSRKPRVSVVVPCYNYARYLPEAVESVLDQTYQDFELIIVNDGSTDDTASVAEGLQAAHPQHRIVVINQESSGQPAISRNNGIEVAQGEYVLCLDADDKIAPTMLEECVTLLDADPGLAIAYTDRQDFGGVDQIVPAGDYDFMRLRFANQISYCALFRREVWRAVGGYRTNVRGCEDWDFWVAAGARGYYGHRIPKPLFLYRRHDTGVYQDALKNFRQRVAQIVVNNSEAYSRHYIDEACAILAGATAGSGRSPRPLVSVIIPTYNRPDRLKLAVESVLRQTYPNFEVIVVNDGGPAAEEAIKESYGGGRVWYVHVGRNLERSAARNLGLRLARGKYIAYLDDDDFYEPQHLETLVEALEASGAQVAYTDARRLWEFKEGDGYVVKRVDQPYSRDFESDAMLVSNYVPILCVMHARSCVEQTGLFDEQLTVYEDWEFFIRLSRKFTFEHVPRVTCAFTHRVDGTSTTSHPRGREFPRVAEAVHRRYASYSADKPAILAAQAQFVQTLERAYGLRPPAGDPVKLSSIVILCRNQAEYTARCVRSIVQHTAEPYELVFVDNASRDETPEVLSMLRGELPNVRVIANRENAGFAGGNNQGLAAARGDVVVLLNNDVVVTPGWLGRLLRPLELHGGLGIVGPRSNFVVGAQLVADVPYADDAGLDKFAAEWAAAHAGEVGETAIVKGFCMAIRRPLIERIGGLDPQFFPGNFEDDDYCLRARLAGYKVAVANDVFVHHYGSRTFKGDNVDYSDAMQTNWARFRAKWGLPEELKVPLAFSIAPILKMKFDPEKHFVPLPAVPVEAAEARAERAPGGSEATATPKRRQPRREGTDVRDAQPAPHVARMRDRFVEKWGRELAGRYPPDPASLHRASNRAPGKRILVVGPAARGGVDGSRLQRLFEMLGALAAGGHAVSFLPSGSLFDEQRTTALRQRGVEVHDGCSNNGNGHGKNGRRGNGTKAKHDGLEVYRRADIVIVVDEAGEHLLPAAIPHAVIHVVPGLCDPSVDGTSAMDTLRAICEADDNQRTPPAQLVGVS
ncbi:MAG: glycosyltransferase [Bacteroidetes bacterium]|nr:glycosyltransferase [Bacteroidota bacterium]MCL5025226.1 glycosyltransferase [Chloroflexota bacterium]